MSFRLIHNLSVLYALVFPIFNSLHLLHLQEVSSMLLEKLIAAGIGDRPVVFVTHRQVCYRLWIIGCIIFLLNLGTLTVSFVLSPISATHVSRGQLRKHSFFLCSLFCWETLKLAYFWGSGLKGLVFSAQFFVLSSPVDFCYSRMIFYVSVGYAPFRKNLTVPRKRTSGF